MKRNILGGILVVLVLIGAVYVGTRDGNATCLSPPKVTININPGGGFTTTEQLEVPCGTTVFEVLDGVAEVKTKEYGELGIFVEGINGLEQDPQKGYYWQYYVDGNLAPVGAGAYKIDRDVTIEWRYEQPPEELSK